MVYIEPTLHVHSTLAAAKEFFDTFGPYSSWADKSVLGISEVAQGNRNLIIGEPGVGKTLLLGKVQEYLRQRNVSTRLIVLKDDTALASIDGFVSSTAPTQKALLLDGLDEVRGNLFPSILKKIEDVSRSQPDISLFVSSRSVFVNKHEGSFPEYRFVSISPFTRSQVRNYLIEAGHRTSDIDTFLDRVMSFNRSTLVIQIPRYLFLLNDYLVKNDIASVKEVFRNQLFEYFIYSKLELEDERLNTSKRAITKRLLEKLALTMELYQTNTISKDEFITFLDDLQSDLKLAALAQIDLDTLFDKSLLKDNRDSIEFENTEFQEYLAAKEITRFPDPRLAAFAFAVEPNINDLHPSWFNTLTFLVEMHPELLEPLVEFSGIRGEKVIDEAFVSFLSRINTNKVAAGLKKRLFKDLLNYHQRRLQWLPESSAPSVSDLFDISEENLLQSEVSRARSETGSKRFIPLGNISLIVGELLKSGANVDREFWRKELLEFASDQNDNGVLQRRALFALTNLKDPSVIAELSPNLMRSDESVRRAFLQVCIAIDPESPISLGYFFEATRGGDIEGRYGLYALQSASALKRFLSTFNTDDDFRTAFLEMTSVFKDQDGVIVDNISKVLDDDLTVLCEEAIAVSLEHDVAHYAVRSAFIVGLGKMLKRKTPGFFARIIDRIRRKRQGAGFFFAIDFIAAILDRPDVAPLIAAMTAAGEQQSAFGVMQRVRSSGRSGAEEIFADGKANLPLQYKMWESSAQAAEETPAVAFESRILDEFRRYLEPAPKQYNPAVFGYYLQYEQTLKPLVSQQDKQRLERLLKGSVLNSIDPGDYDLTVTGEQGGHTTSYVVSSHISVFGSALLVAYRLVLDVGEFRQRIINYIPFAYSDHLQAILKLCPNITTAELGKVISIYSERKSDLWRHQPGNLVYTAEQYHVVAAAPVLKVLARESALAVDVRVRALKVAESLVPDREFLRQAFSAFSASTNAGDATVADTATELLISAYSDPDAIRRRLRAVIERAVPFVTPAGAHAVSSLEEEITGGGGFAGPLGKVRTRGFEDDYLKLLDHAMQLWSKGKPFYQYASYLWNIVYAYFDNLKECGSYEPLNALERKITSLRNAEGSNWLAAKMIQLRRIYLGFLGRPQNIGEAIRQYNQGRNHDNKKIVNSGDLAYQLQEVISTDLTRWIQAEGAYDLLLTGKVYKARVQQYEKLVQKTLKSQLENILLKRGFQVEVLREPQLLDEKRIDLLVRYGFTGPIVIEVKLTSHTDMQTSRPERSTSYASMKRYMDGYGASHGFFLVIDNKATKNLQRITEAFQCIPNVWVKVFDYRNRRNKRRGTRRARRRQRHR